MPVTSVHAARPDDWPRIAELLVAAELPVDDLSKSSTRLFIVAVGSERVVGAAAVEPHGNDGLLRSLVVDPQWRHRGLGFSLVKASEASARDAGLGSLTLLTQTAAPFFRALGYREVPRNEAPASLHQCAEFAHLCPSSSVCMTKALDIAAGLPT